MSVACRRGDLAGHRGDSQIPNELARVGQKTARCGPGARGGMLDRAARWAERLARSLQRSSAGEECTIRTPSGKWAARSSSTARRFGTTRASRGAPCGGIASLPSRCSSGSWASRWPRCTRCRASTTSKPRCSPSRTRRWLWRVRRRTPARRRRELSRRSGAARTSPGSCARPIWRNTTPSIGRRCSARATGSSVCSARRRPSGNGPTRWSTCSRRSSPPGPPTGRSPSPSTGAIRGWRCAWWTRPSRTTSCRATRRKSRRWSNRSASSGATRRSRRRTWTMPWSRSRRCAPSRKSRRPAAHRPRLTLRHNVVSCVARRRAPTPG